MMSIFYKLNLNYYFIVAVSVMLKIIESSFVVYNHSAFFNDKPISGEPSTRYSNQFLFNIPSKGILKLSDLVQPSVSPSSYSSSFIHLLCSPRTNEYNLYVYELFLLQSELEILNVKTSLNLCST